MDIELDIEKNGSSWCAQKYASKPPSAVKVLSQWYQIMDGHWVSTRNGPSTVLTKPSPKFHGFS